MTPFLILQIALVGILLAMSVYGIKHTKSKYRDRNDFSRRNKRIIRREIQNGKCPLCRKKLYGRIEYHHKDGNRSNNRLSNGQAMHRHCHMLITGKNQKHYRNQTNWSSLKWTIVSTFMLLIILVVSVHY